MRKLALLLFVLMCYVFVNDPAGVFTPAPAPIQSVQSCDPHKFVNPCAHLDTSQIDWETDNVPIILPTDANPGTTPVIMLDGTYVPEESPDGGYPVDWADNSPVYSDGWMLQVNDSTNTIQWIAPTDNGA